MHRQETLWAKGRFEPNPFGGVHAAHGADLFSASLGLSKSVPITVTGSATTSDALVAIERLRIANERSILENIKAFINEFAKLAP